jgi:hypothetical protein
MLMARFGTIGVGPGADMAAIISTPELQAAVTAGMADAWAEFATYKATELDTGNKSSADGFGTRAFLNNDYMSRMAAAVTVGRRPARASSATRVAMCQSSAPTTTAATVSASSCNRSGSTLREQSMAQPSTAPRWKMIHSVPTADRSRSQSRGGSSSAAGSGDLTVLSQMGLSRSGLRFAPKLHDGHPSAWYPRASWQHATRRLREMPTWNCVRSRHVKRSCSWTM